MRILLITLFFLAYSNLGQAQSKMKIKSFEPEDGIETIEGDDAVDSAIENRENDKLDAEIQYDDEKKRAEEQKAIDLENEPINKKTVGNVKDQMKERYPDDGVHTQIVPYYANKPAPKLQKRLRNGTKIYKVQQSPQHYSGGVRVGPYYPSKLTGDTLGVTYQSMYGKVSPVLVNFDFEYQFFKNPGKLGLQTSLGFFTAQGNGRFKTHPTDIPADEVFTLYTFPIQLTALYHAQFWDKQPIVPFAGAGVSYFGMIESRGDKDKFSDSVKFGGGAAFQWTAGVQIQLDWLDREVIWELDHDYGINHIYLTADARQYLGLSNIYDFSAFYYEGGLLFEF